jgi:glycosyltransferase involved in cell wall biosynthesis
MPHQAETRMPAVTAITIFHDAERFLREAVASVLAQTWRDWELLLVDDGSTDGSGAIARALADEHPGRIRCLTHPGGANRGMSASRNLGIAHARGGYVAFLDADDVWMPRALERQVAALDAAPGAGMVAGTTEYWFGWTGRPEDAGRDHVPPTGLPAGTVVAPPALLLRFLRDETRSPGTCSVLVRRETLAAVGGFEESFRGMYEDQAFLAKVCLTVPVLLSGECVARYRQHAESCYSRSRADGEATAAEERYLRWLAGWSARHRRADGPEWKALRRILWRHRHPLLHRLMRRLPAAVRRAALASR